LPVEHLHNEPLLVYEMQSGSQEAFTSLYRHYSPLLYMNIRRMLHDPIATEELVQELFTRVWQNRESKAIAENFSGYIYRIAQHLVIDFFRRLKKDHALQEIFRKLAEQNCETGNVADEFQQQESMTIINNAIEHLPPQQKKAYKLVREEGYTYKKAAVNMGISPFTVKEYLSLANKSIRNYILHHVDSPGNIVLSALICLTITSFNG
jgi:RNA polymerase sigma-70 factor (ECF subfamily)